MVKITSTEALQIFFDNIGEIIKYKLESFVQAEFSSKIKELLKDLEDETLERLFERNWEKEFFYSDVMLKDIEQTKATSEKVAENFIEISQYLPSEPNPSRVDKKWDKYFMQIAENAASQSKKQKDNMDHNEGAVIVNKRIVLGIGWSGLATKLPDKYFKSFSNAERRLSAIQNAFIFASTGRFDIKGATIFCTHYPDWKSALLFIQYDVAHVVYKSLKPLEKIEELGVEYILRLKQITVNQIPQAMDQL